MNKKYGINDDCIITKVSDDQFFVAINAAYINAHLQKQLML
jgi:glycine cleavage system aminomethyltransferase T